MEFVRTNLHLRCLERPGGVPMVDSLVAHVPAGVVGVAGVSARVHGLVLGGLRFRVSQASFDVHEGVTGLFILRMTGDTDSGVPCRFLDSK